MQAWQQIQVTNEQSGYFGQAGVVQRVERNGNGDATGVMVKLDTVDEVQNFAPSELRVLG